MTRVLPNQRWYAFDDELTYSMHFTDPHSHRDTVMPTKRITGVLPKQTLPFSSASPILRMAHVSCAKKLIGETASAICRTETSPTSSDDVRLSSWRPRSGRRFDTPLSCRYFVRFKKTRSIVSIGSIRPTIHHLTDISGQDFLMDTAIGDLHDLVAYGSRKFEPPNVANLTAQMLDAMNVSVS